MVAGAGCSHRARSPAAGQKAALAHGRGQHHLHPRGADHGHDRAGLGSARHAGPCSSGSAGLRQWAHTPARQLGLWLLYLACFDFLYYWLHRAQHQIPWLWRYHMVHHSDVNVCAASVGRHHWLEEGFRFFIITAPLIMLMGGAQGSPPWVAAFIVLNGILMHWNVAIRFGPLERCIITPAYHRIHHSIEARHYDKNFGVFTQLWDRVFGTRHVPAPGEYPETGITRLSGLRGWALLAPWPLIWLDRTDGSGPKKH
ncbi:MAG: sterol desaturase family protein [Proteobacteria bacterium]|nr:sterol desaturase family protein [Pseudomonadota bacterium]